jgi:hypothetical protein
LHPDVIAERTASRKADAPVPNAINALEILDEKFWAEVTTAFREFVETHVNKLKAENLALAARIKCLEDRPALKYCGVWTAAKHIPKIRWSQNQAACGLQNGPLRHFRVVVPSPTAGNFA